jgi:subtilisin family serine protease
MFRFDRRTAPAIHSRVARFRLLGQSLELRALLAIDFPSLIVEAGDPDPGSILVRFKDDAPAAAGPAWSAESTPLAPWAQRLRRVSVPAEMGVGAALQAMRANPNVLYAEPNYRVRAAQIPNDPRFGELWGMENVAQTGGVNDADIDASGAWDVHTGSGSMIVAVIDTGIDYTHPDLAANIWVNADEIPGDGLDNDGNGYVDDIHGYDFLNRDGNPQDDNGHGTHVAGTIGAVGNNGLGVTGVNWNIRIMALKFLGADGSGTTADAIEAVAYAVANGARISNNSWGGDPYSQAMFDVIVEARDAGHLFVAAAGNGNALGIGLNNDTTPFYPSGYELDNIIAVAAVDHNDNLASFSNYGAATVDLAAPGVNILSTTPGGGYGTSSGTSMAAPHVAGVAALVWDAHPGWTYSEVVSQILSTVDPLPSLAGVTATGGRLNAASALGAPQPPPPPPPPTALPMFEDFQDGAANFFDRQAGVWNVAGGRYQASPSADDDDVPVISTLRLETPLPEAVELEATLYAEEGRLVLFGLVLRDYLTNAFLVFDYQSLDDFKFAGADMDGDRWVIGHRDSAGWTIDAFFSQTLSAATDYAVRLTIAAGGQVTLMAGGATVLVHAFGESVTDGSLGVGSRNALARFDNVAAQQANSPTPGALPLLEDFDDGAADHLQRHSGLASVSGGEYHVTPLTGGDAVSTLLVSDPLPQHLEIEASFNADPVTAGRFSNGFLIFDYHGPADFKFAGAYVGGDQWLIGRRNASGWIIDASVAATIEALTDYHLQLTIEAGGYATLYEGGVPRVAYSFADVLTDGAAGVGTQNALARFDNLALREFSPPPSATLPYLEDFDDGAAEFLIARTGDWAVSGGRYQSTPVVEDDSLATLRLDALPANVELAATFNADDATPDRLSNAFLIFDYRGPLDFKFAGAHVGGDQWVMGRRTSAGWIVDASRTFVIDPLTDYRLRLVLEDNRSATLYADDAPQITHVFTDLMTDGAIGLATRDAVARFDDFSASEFVPPPRATLPHADDYNDGVADFFQLRSGDWVVANGRYGVTPAANADGISTFDISSLPARVEVGAVINADPASSGRFSNAVLVFDYQGPTDFKFAGAYVGGDQWIIGHRTSSGWITDAAASAVIDPLTDYDLRVTIDGGVATLYADGAVRASFAFSGSLTDGAVGLGTNNALSRFDDFSVIETPAPPLPTLPLSENFDDEVADYLQPRSGAWTIGAGRYSVTPAANSDGVSTLQFPSLPSDLEIAVTINADDVSSGRYSNAFIIFDYQGPTNFKFAGVYVGSKQWLIGRRTTSGWITDAAVSAVVAPYTDHHLRLTISNSGMANLYADDVLRVTRQYSESLTDGAVGLGTSNAISRFDNLTVQSLAASFQAANTSSTAAGEDPFSPWSASTEQFIGARSLRSETERRQPQASAASPPAQFSTCRTPPSLPGQIDDVFSSNDLQSIWESDPWRIIDERIIERP